MKNFIWLFLFASFVRLSAVEIPIHEAFVTRYTEVILPFSAPKAPPAPINENIPPRPSEDEIWIPGYWEWIDSNNDFYWVCGVWRRPPPNQYWISGNWISGNGWQRIKGFWSPVPFERLIYIAKVPPQGISEKIPHSPGNNYFWVPGYWNYSSNNYSWLSGKWEQFNQNWILTPASYYWRPEGYVFVPIFWDWPLDLRGHATSCHDGVAFTPEIIVQNLFLYYPDYHILYWHWWHFHPGWVWDGCGCVPPWWWWNDWWGWGWGDMWGLWWWWGHPGFFPPFWLVWELAQEIAPPPIVVIDAFSKIKKPDFPITPGDEPLLPKGPGDNKDVPKPQPPTDVRPTGPVVLPPLPTPPGGQVTTPPVPPQGRPPQQDYTPPSQGYNPPQYVPPQNGGEYVPPRRDVPPNRTPPRQPPTRQPTPPTRQPPTTRPPTKPNYQPPTTKPQTTAPSRTDPKSSTYK